MTAYVVFVQVITLAAMAVAAMVVYGWVERILAWWGI